MLLDQQRERASERQEQQSGNRLLTALCYSANWFRIVGCSAHPELARLSVSRSAAASAAALLLFAVSDGMQNAASTLLRLPHTQPHPKTNPKPKRHGHGVRIEERPVSLLLQIDVDGAHCKGFLMRFMLLGY